MIYVDAYRGAPAVKVQRHQFEKESDVMSKVTIKKSLFMSNEIPLEQMVVSPCLCKNGDYVDQRVILGFSKVLFDELERQSLLPKLCRLFKLDAKRAEQFTMLFKDLAPVYQDTMVRDAGTESASVFGNDKDDLYVDFDKQVNLDWSLNDGNFTERGNLCDDPSEVEMGEVLSQFLSEAEHNAHQKFSLALSNMLVQRAGIDTAELNLKGRIPLDEKQVFLMMKKALLV